ncbi:YggS family pyridoxal phosphate-dependent enzyme [Salicibibacter cibarius]|uniref:Pyridoxal phosphate homeostasis protein n=1 Tax=Salicibibacter cibarius TaxID=2743000 RepID=A0A7T6Z484_9BACI|nr:YggS family pyridoxal phosphate-dependent enzyme [Salicibibacter cibarius]QQK76723.1 YggS family pyridoxal phosphate-dependent enzyme [Salicibibacter cibarius]
MNIKENYEAIMARVSAACERAGRSPEDVTVMAVTKYVSAERVEKAIAAGVKHFGESRDGGLLEKKQAIKAPVHWHFVGRMQSRKVKEVIHECDVIHSLDRASLAKEINKRYQRETPIDCMVQVNVSGEETKAGVAPDQLENFVRALESYEHIRVAGLMTMAPHTKNPEDVRPYFRQLRELCDDIKRLQLPHAPCQHLSMGMSNDFEQAVEEGATIIRLGTSLVGNETGREA